MDDQRLRYLFLIFGVIFIILGSIFNYSHAYSILISFVFGTFSMVLGALFLWYYDKLISNLNKKNAE